MDDDATQALNQIAAILKIAHQDAIAEAASAVRADKTSKAILASTSKWISTGSLQSAAVKRALARNRQSCVAFLSLSVQGSLSGAKLAAGLLSTSPADSPDARVA